MISLHLHHTFMDATKCHIGLWDDSAHFTSLGFLNNPILSQAGEINMCNSPFAGNIEHWRNNSEVN